MTPDADTTANVPDAPSGRRHRRRSRPRAQTTPRKRLTRAFLRAQASPLDAETLAEHQRPRTRGDCIDAPRPCPWISCKHNLYLDINPETGSIKINVPEREPWEVEHSCALDVAERGASTLEGIAQIMNLTRERVRQLELRGLHQLHGLATGGFGLEADRVANNTPPLGGRNG